MEFRRSTEITLVRNILTVLTGIISLQGDENDRIEQCIEDVNKTILVSAHSLAVKVLQDFKTPFIVSTIKRSTSIKHG